MLTNEGNCLQNKLNSTVSGKTDYKNCYILIIITITLTHSLSLCLTKHLAMQTY